MQVVRAGLRHILCNHPSRGTKLGIVIRRGELGLLDRVLVRHNGLKTTEPDRGYGNPVKCVLASGVELAIRRYAVLLGRVFERGRLKNKFDYAGYELVKFGHVAA